MESYKPTSEIRKSLDQLKAAPFFSVDEAQSKGLSRTTLSRLNRAGILLKLDRGYYRLAKGSKSLGENPDFAIAYHRFGADSYISGLSALFYYGLTEQAPTKIWVHVSQDQKTSLRTYKLLRSIAKSRQGLEVKDGFQISNIERTLLEAMKYQTKIGNQLVLQVLDAALKNKKTNLDKLFEMAKKLKLTKVLEKYWDYLVTK